MSDTDIVGSDRRDIAATDRRGEFSYRLPVQVERYRVTLTFVEQDRAEKFGVFAVRLNGQTGLNQYGVRAEGWLAVTESFTATANNAVILLQFIPQTGNARAWTSRTGSRI